MIEIASPTTKLKAAYKGINESVAYQEEALANYQKDGTTMDIDRVKEKLAFFCQKREEYRKAIELLTQTKVSIQTTTRRNHTIVASVRFSEDMKENGCVIWENQKRDKQCSK